MFQMSSRELPYAGAAVLVERGSCTFSDKAQALSAAHAAVMIVYNNDEGRYGDTSLGNLLPSSMFTQHP